VTAKPNLYEGLGTKPMNWSVRDRATEVTKVEGESSEESAELWFGGSADFVQRSRPSETSLTAAAESSDEFSIDITCLDARWARLSTTTELTESGEASDEESFIANQLDIS
jgi:hypothetical protein